jgi:rhodanese-related sulfurtransferase
MAIKHLQPSEAHEILNGTADATYLDVRTEGEFAKGHAAGAINVPVVFIKGPGQFQANPDFIDVVEKLLPKSRKLVVGCQSGVRSQRACELLEGAGFGDLINVLGGFGGQRDQSGATLVTGWRDAGLPVSAELGDATYEALRKKAGI